MSITTEEINHIKANIVTVIHQSLHFEYLL